MGSDVILKKIPEKEERIKICSSSTCDNCVLSNIWCFEDVSDNKALQQSLFEDFENEDANYC